MLGLYPFIRAANERTTKLRGDAIETAWFMRQDIESAFRSGGMYLVLSGAFGLLVCRGQRGQLKLSRAALAVVPSYIFLMSAVFQALAILPFASTIYDTTTNSVAPLSFSDLKKLRIGSFGCAIIAFFVLFAWFRRSITPAAEGPHCGDCGYSLHGLPGKRCPECGTSVDDLPPVYKDGI